MYPIHYSKANRSEIQIVLGILHLSENPSSTDAYIEVEVDCLLARVPDGGSCLLVKLQQTSACYQILTEASANTPSAKSLQSCPTLCDTIDSSPPGSPIPGILQARTYVKCKHKIILL